MNSESLGHYRDLRPIGAGGMGEVFVAHDSKLDRKVALKVLPAEVANDPDRRERFTREARAVAALNHPNIVTVHAVEEADETHFLVMEFVEGKTLSTLLPSKGFPLGQLLTLAIPLADAVAAAHDKNITHRDLKPANVMVGTDGRVKVLDFGLAKLRDSVTAAESSLTALGPRPLTGEGRIVGTVSYMSPEQAQGQPVDHRSDIFSLGVMLYEMSTGERPFKGDSTVSTLSSILRDTPDMVSETRPELPRELARIIRRALMKDPERRYQSAKDLRNELEEVKQDLTSGDLEAVRAATKAPPTSGKVVYVAGAALALAAVAFGWWYLKSDSAPAPLELSFDHVTSKPGVETTPSLSPDGKWIIYASEGDIHLQSVGGQTSINLTKGEGISIQPVFSPDGERIAFSRGGGLFVMTKTGESVRRLTGPGYHPAWTPDGKSIVYSTVSVADPENRIGIGQGWIVDVASGQAKELFAGDFVQPSVSPHGQRIAFWALPVTSDRRFTTGGVRDLWTIRMDGSDPVRVTEDAATDWSPLWSHDGRFLLWSSDRGGSMNLWRVPIDEASGRLLGSAQAITTPSTYLGNLTRSADGSRFAYSSHDYRRNIARVPFDADRGVVTGPLEPITSGTLDWNTPDVSPDGESVAFVSYHRQENLYVAQREPAGTWRLTQITNDAARDRGPVWSRDGKQLAFYTNRTGAYTLWTINPDGSDARERARAPAGSGIYFPEWSPDGSQVLTTDLHLLRNYVWRLSSALETVPLLTFAAPPEAGTAFWSMSWSVDNKIAGFAGSPNSVWVYSMADKTYTRMAPGTQPVWMKDGRRLIYPSGGRLMILDTNTKQPREIFAIPGEVVGYPLLSRDNRFLYFSHAITGADIWMMTIK